MSKNDNKSFFSKKANQDHKQANEGNEFKEKELPKMEELKEIIEEDGEALKNEVSIPVQNYFIINVFVFIFGMIPSILIMGYYDEFLRIIGLDTLFGHTSQNIFGIEDFWIWFWFPLFLLLSIYIGILAIGLLSKLFTIYWNKKSPPKEGLFIRQFDGKDVTDPRIKYYHYRGFIIKPILWLASKSPFPWMKYWVLKYVGENEISKTAEYLDAFACLEFSFLEEGVIFYPGSMASSHVVDSLYGNLTIERVVVDKNCIMNCNSILAPGVYLNENSVLMPNAFAIKKWKSKDNIKFYYGVPARSAEDFYKGIFSRLENIGASSNIEEEFLKKGFVLFKRI
ncbi:MAG: hypothetical protein ACTSRZ_11040 [Promethearchaeota archaeon]